MRTYLNSDKDINSTLSIVLSGKELIHVIGVFNDGIQIDFYFQLQYHQLLHKRVCIPLYQVVLVISW